jgi:RHS repeat-associated protein
VNSQRMYAVPGGTVLRYAQGSAASSLTALAGDHQGTPYAEVALNGGMTTRIRKQDPFGNQRAAARVGQNIQTNTGFLGAVRDDASGYTPLGARLYDPVVGRFLSADPVLDLADPLQSNGYTYARNNPVTLSDPTGLSEVELTQSETAAVLAGVGLSAAQVAEAEANANRSLTSVILSVAWNVLAEFIGINDAIRCFGGDLWSCGMLILDAIPWGKIAKIGKVKRAVEATISAIKAWKVAKRAAEAVLKVARAAITAAKDAKRLAIEKAKRAAQLAAKKAADKLKTTGDKVVNATKKTGNPVQKRAQARANPKGSSAGSGGKKSGGGGGKSGSKSGGSAGASERSNGGSTGGSCKDNSFVPGTLVLMADGSAKSIEDVEPGDKVKATDPETGETEVETVSASIKGDGVKHLVKITIDTDGERGKDTAEVTATDGHPFWVPELGEWVDATDLRSGEWLRTSAGTYVQITAIERWTVLQATVHNLTVANIHTYYVMAGDQPVLVHNCGGPSEIDAKLARDRAEGLQGLRDDYPNAANHGTTSVMGVYNKTTGQWTNHIAINGDGPMPSGWTLGPGEKFVQGAGHGPGVVRECPV